MLCSFLEKPVIRSRSFQKSEQIENNYKACLVDKVQKETK